MKHFCTNLPQFRHFNPLKGETTKDIVDNFRPYIMSLLEDDGLPYSKFDEVAEDLEDSLYEVRYCKKCNDDKVMDEFTFDRKGELCDECYQEGLDERN